MGADKSEEVEHPLKQLRQSSKQRSGLPVSSQEARPRSVAWSFAQAPCVYSGFQVGKAIFDCGSNQDPVPTRVEETASRKVAFQGLDPRWRRQHVARKEENAEKRNANGLPRSSNTDDEYVMCLFVVLLLVARSFFPHTFTGETCQETNPAKGARKGKLTKRGQALRPERKRHFQQFIVIKWLDRFSRSREGRKPLRENELISRSLLS